MPDCDFRQPRAAYRTPEASPGREPEGPPLRIGEASLVASDRESPGSQPARPPTSSFLLPLSAPAINMTIQDAYQMLDIHSHRAIITAS
jgi:hypothetical protein